MLHVHGGSVLLDRLRTAGVPGAFLEWCDVLCQGPTPAAVTATEWRDIRARFLDDASGPHGNVHERLVAQDAALARGLAEHDEVVLWFSADWFCQAILLCLLARLDDDAVDFVLDRVPPLTELRFDLTALLQRPIAAGVVITQRGHRLLLGALASEGPLALQRVQRKLPRRVAALRVPQLAPRQLDQLRELMLACIVPERLPQWDWLF